MSTLQIHIFTENAYEHVFYISLYIYVRQIYFIIYLRKYTSCPTLVKSKKNINILRDLKNCKSF